MKKQNKLTTYLTVTAGVGCAASSAEAAIVVVNNPTQLRTASAIGDLIIPSQYTAPSTGKYGPISGRLSLYFSPGNDSLAMRPLATYDFLRAGDTSYSFSNWLEGHDLLSIAVPFGSSTPEQIGALWAPLLFSDIPDGMGTNGGGYTESELSWFRMIVTDGPNPTITIDRMVYDDGGADVSFAEAVAAAVPEPSSLALLALGATGLACRRQRRKAA